MFVALRVFHGFMSTVIQVRRCIVAVVIAGKTLAETNVHIIFDYYYYIVRIYGFLILTKLPMECAS